MSNYIYKHKYMIYKTGFRRKSVDLFESVSQQNNTLARRRNVIDKIRVNNAFSCWNKIYFDGDKISFIVSYDKQNLTLAVISYAIYETRRRLVS